MPVVKFNSRSSRSEASRGLRTKAISRSPPSAQSECKTPVTPQASSNATSRREASESVATSTASSVVSLVTEVVKAVTEVPYVGAIATNVMTLIKIREEVRNHNERCQELLDRVLEKIEEIFTHLIHLKECDNHADLERLEAQMEEYDDFLTQVVETVTRIHKRRNYRRVLEEDTDELESLDRHINSLDSSLVLDVVMEILKLNEAPKVGGDREMMQDSSTSPHFPQAPIRVLQREEQHRDIVAKRRVCSGTPSTRTDNSESIIATSGIKSEMICAKEVADFLQSEQGTIQHALNKRLLGFGFSGEYLLCAGFNEALLCRGIEHPEVFLILNGDLKDDDVAISKCLSPIFSPHTAVLHMESRVLDLIPPDELELPFSSQKPSLSPAPINQLNSTDQSRPIETSGGSQRFCDERGQESTSNPPRDDEDKDKQPDEERDGEKQMDKGKGKAKEDDKVLDEYRRQLQLRLETPLIINATASKECRGASYEFNLDTKIHIRLRSNRRGRDWKEFAEDASNHIPLDPLCSVSLDSITTSRGGTPLHSLTALQVHVEATSQTINTCEQLLPNPTRRTDIKISSETRMKGGGSATLGLKPEAKLELGLEKAVREESTRPAWTINTHRMKKSSAYVATVDYTLNGSEEVPSEDFQPGPSAIFSYELDLTDSSLSISVRALWSLRLDSTPKNRFKQVFGRRTANSPNLIYANFFHKFSFAVKLEDLMREGKDDVILRGKNAFVDDSIQDSREARGSMFAAMPIQIKLDGEPVIEVPLRRTVSAAIKRDDWEEGEQQVTSPDPDPFQRTGDAKA